MGRITCKDCGKTWGSKAMFNADPGCDRGWCENSEEALMGRRKGRAGKDKPPHIEVLEKGGEVAEQKNPKIHSHTTHSQILSSWDANEEIVGMEKHDAININIFVRL